MKIMKLLTGSKGFTLVELLVVVAILGVLAVVVVPNVSKLVGKGSTQAASTELVNIQTALDTAMSDKGLTAVLAKSSCTDLSSAGGCQLDLGADGLAGTADDVYLYPDYLRIKTPGDSRSYAWTIGGLVTQS